MKRMLNRLTFSRKLGLMSGSFLLPLLTLLYFVWQGIAGQIVGEAGRGFAVVAGKGKGSSGRSSVSG